MKLFIWLVVALAVVVWLKRLKGNIQKAQQPQRQTPPTAVPASEGAGERMVQCAHCGIHFPASEAVTSLSGAVFCSPEHKQLSA
jgi:uncharacterized protein